MPTPPTDTLSALELSSAALDHRYDTVLSSLRNRRHADIPGLEELDQLVGARLAAADDRFLMQVRQMRTTADELRTAILGVCPDPMGWSDADDDGGPGLRVMLPG